MGRKAISGGVTNFRGKCRVDFKYEGQRYQPVLDLEYNARNVRATQKMMETVRAKIEHGVFDPAAYFPDYAGLKRMAVATTSGSAKTFADYAELWQASISEKAAATREDYRKILNRVWLPALRDRPIASIRYSDLLAVLSDYPAMTGKTRNNNLIPLRGVFALAKKDHAINDDPAAELENSKVQVPEPDPFELHEVEQILADLAAHTPAPVVNYFTAAFFTGIRPSELIAIRWADVDFNRRAVRVQRAIVRGKAKATTKTTARYSAIQRPISRGPTFRCSGKSGTCHCVGASCAIECHTRHGTRMRRSHCTSPERVQDTLPDNSGTPIPACCSRSTPSGSTGRTISANARSSTPHLCTICAQRGGTIQQLLDTAN